MNVESSHLQIRAVTEAFKVGVHLAYLDRVCCCPRPEPWLRFQFARHASSIVPHSHLTPVRVPLPVEQTPGAEPTVHNMADADGACRVHLLYRPGHYDIIYQDE